jgi:hypothetical protein
LKIKLPSFLRSAWLLLTEVPGWPDAPRSIRLRRALPLALPATALLTLMLWNAAIVQPRTQAERAAHQPLVDLEAEIQALRLTCSDQEAGDLAARAAEADAQLAADPAEAGALLRTLKATAAEKGWDAVFHVADASTEPAADDAQLVFVSAKGRLAPSASPISGHLTRFSSLLALLEQFSPSNRRIDLTRLAIRADEQGRYSVEVNLRLACRIAHEKTP